jgi:hypothetical protein
VAEAFTVPPFVDIPDPRPIAGISRDSRLADETGAGVIANHWAQG